MNKLIVIFIVSLFINSCVDINAYQDDMRKLRKDFPDSSLVHFPSTLNSTYNLISTFPNGYSKNNRCGALLIYNQNSKKTEELKIISKEKYKEFSYNDSCVVVLNNNHEIQKKKSLCKSNIKPLPDIQRLIEECRFCNNLDIINGADLKYFLVEAKPGVFIEEKHFKKPFNYTKVWKHGISKGIAINENNGTVIFWLEIW